MEGLLFWLVPVALLVVFTLVALAHLGENRKPLLTLIEPLGTLVLGWRLARSIGPTKPMAAALRLLKGSTLSDGSLFEQLLITLEPRGKTAVSELLHHESLPLWGAQRVFATEGRVWSLLIGDITEVLPLVKYTEDGKTLFKKSDQTEVEKTVISAGEHGYLAVAVASRYIHGRVFDSHDHSWLGLFILEPIIDENVRAQIAAVSPSKLKLLSVLPAELLQFLITKVRGSGQFAGIPHRPVEHPRAKEDRWAAAPFIARADFKERYAAARYFSLKSTCRIISANPQDKELPKELG